MSGARRIPVEAARSMLLSVDDLWMDYFALGGSLARMSVHAFLNGDRAVGDLDFDLLVQALNERFTERGEDHPLDYADELAGDSEPL